MTKRYGKKMLTVMVLGAFLILGLSSLGQAQEMQVMKDSAKMMSDAWKMFNDGQRSVIQGLEMNNQVAAQKGFDNEMGPGNKVTIGRPGHCAARGHPVCPGGKGRHAGQRRPGV